MSEKWCEHIVYQHGTRKPYLLDSYYDRPPYDGHVGTNWKNCPICGACRPVFKKNFSEIAQEAYVQTIPREYREYLDNWNAVAKAMLDEIEKEIDDYEGRVLAFPAGVADGLKQRLRERL